MLEIDVDIGRFVALGAEEAAEHQADFSGIELGYAQAPVVVNNADDQDHWAGLRRDKLVTAAMNHAREGASV